VDSGGVRADSAERPRTKRSMFNVETYAYHGPALYDGKKYRSSIQPTATTVTGCRRHQRWIAALQHHFVTAIVPAKDEPYRFTLNSAADQYRLAAEGPAHTVAPGGSAKFGTDIFVGPKLQRQLKATGPDLARVTDYGYLYVLAQPLFIVLDAVDSFFGNWGVAIILVTFLLKLAFYPLSEASGRSMAKMKQLQRGSKICRRPTGRCGEARPRHDGAVSAREDQSDRRLSAHHYPDTGVPGVLLGAARERRDAPGALCLLDTRPVLT